MTISEALDWMQAHFPRVTACAQKNGCYHPRQDEKRPVAEYFISAQPGFDGHGCQIFSGSSLDQCIKKIQDATRAQIEDTANDE